MSSISDNNGSFVAQQPSKVAKHVSSTSNRKKAPDMWNHFTKNDCEIWDNVIA